MEYYGVTVQIKPLQQYFQSYYSYLHISQNGIWDFSRTLILGTFGSKRVKVNDNLIRSQHKSTY